MRKTSAPSAPLTRRARRLRAAVARPYRGTPARRPAGLRGALRLRRPRSKAAGVGSPRGLRSSEGIQPLPAHAHTGRDFGRGRTAGLGLRRRQSFGGLPARRALAALSCANERAEFPSRPAQEEEFGSSSMISSRMMRRRTFVRPPSSKVSVSSVWRVLGVPLASWSPVDSPRSNLPAALPTAPPEAPVVELVRSPYSVSRLDDPLLAPSFRSDCPPSSPLPSSPEPE